MSRRNRSLKRGRLGRGHGEAVGAERRRLAEAQRADQELVPDQALQQALRPAEEVRAGVHAQRGIEVEHDRLDLQEVGGGGASRIVGRVAVALCDRHDCGIGCACIGLAVLVSAVVVGMAALNIVEVITQ